MDWITSYLLTLILKTLGRNSTACFYQDAPSKNMLSVGKHILRGSPKVISRYLISPTPLFHLTVSSKNVILCNCSWSRTSMERLLSLCSIISSRVREWSDLWTLVSSLAIGWIGDLCYMVKIKSNEYLPDGNIWNKIIALLLKVRLWRRGAPVLFLLWWARRHFTSLKYRFHKYILINNNCESCHITDF